MDVVKDLPEEAKFEKVLDQLGKRRHDVEKYLYLLRKLRCRNVAQDLAYRCVFESFYVVRFKEENWLRAYFEILEREKGNAAVSFRDVLKEMWEETHRMEASYSSKLVATINPEKPVWDQWVLHNLRLKKVYRGKGGDDYLKRCVTRYEEICETTRAVVEKGPNFRKWVARLDEAFPDYADSSEAKKLGCSYGCQGNSMCTC